MPKNLPIEAVWLKLEGFCVEKRLIYAQYQHSLVGTRMLLYVDFVSLLIYLTAPFESRRISFSPVLSIKGAKSFFVHLTTL
jgi:hypothetical protein